MSAATRRRKRAIREASMPPMSAASRKRKRAVRIAVDLAAYEAQYEAQRAAQELQLREQRELAAAARAKLIAEWTAPEPVPERYTPHSQAIEQWIADSRATWIAIGSAGLVRAHKVVIDAAPGSGWQSDECKICGHLWPVDGSYASAHVAEHARQWLQSSGYVVPAYYEHADVLADALVRAFDRAGQALAELRARR